MPAGKSHRSRSLLITAMVPFALCGADFPRMADSTTWFRHDGGVAAPAEVAVLPEDFGDPDHRLWRCEMLPGHSSPCVVGQRAFLTTWDAEHQSLATVAIDTESGKSLWERPVATERIEEFHATGSPAASTIASDGKRLFVFFGSVGLLCYDLDGKLQWSRPMGPFQDEFGACSSPVVIDGNVILNEDHDINSFLIALDAETGKVVWTTARDGFTRSYATPLVIEVDGQRQIVVAGSLRLTAYDPDDGRPLWWVDGLSRIVDSTPVFADGRIYLATWTPGGDPGDRISMESFAEALTAYDADGDQRIAKSELPTGAVLTRFFRIDLNQDETLDAEEWRKHADVFEKARNVAMAIRPGGHENVTETNIDWIYDRGLPTVPSSTVYNGVLFMVKDSGIITALNARDGTLLTQLRSRGPGNYYASVIAGDGKVYFASERGVVTVLHANPEDGILGSHDFGERIVATPVIAESRIYLRTAAALYCFQGAESR